MEKVINFCHFLKNSITVKKCLYWAVLLSTAIYIFSIPAFSNRGLLKLISYGSIIFLIFSEFLYIFLYSKVSVNKALIIPSTFVLFSLIGTLTYSHDYRRWFTLVLMLTSLFALYFSAQIIGDFRKIIKITIIAFLLFGIYFLFTYFRQIINLSFLNGSRLGDLFDNVNAVGFYFCVAFSLSLYIAIMPNKKIEVLYLIPAIIFFAFGTFTGSRSFIVVAFVSIVLIFFIRLRKRKILFFFAFAAVIALSIILISFIPFLKDQFERTIFTIFGIGNSKIDSSTVERAVWIKYGLTLGSQKIVFGYGVNGFSIISGLETYSHNNFIEVFCNFGLTGFVLYYFILVYPLFKSILSKNVDIYIVSLIVVLLITRGLFGVTYYSKESYALLGISYFFISDTNTNLFNKKNINYNIEVPI